MSGEDAEMAKKIKFPLEMASGVQVRSLEELKENFELEKVIEYYMNGKLFIWLKDRYYDNEADQISKLDSKDKNLKEKICNVFHVEYTASQEIDIIKLKVRAKRTFELKKYTDDEEIIKSIDKVAFSQEELTSLLYEGVNLIYLCGRQFIIPLNKENVTYIGVNNPIAIINSEVFVDFSKRNILLKNVIYNEKYQNIIKNNSVKKEKVKTEVSAAQYKTSALFDPIMMIVDRKESSRIFDVINSKLSEINCSIDEKTRSRVDIIRHADLGGMFDNYLDRIS